MAFVIQISTVFMFFTLVFGDNFFYFQCNQNVIAMKVLTYMCPFIIYCLTK